MEKIFLNDNPSLIKNTVEIIGATTYFRTVDTELLKEVIQNSWIFELDSAEYLIRETKKSDRMVYILLGGEFDVFAGGKFILKINQPGQTIGEMAVISPDTPRSADVITTSPSRVVAIESSFLERKDPKTAELAKTFLMLFSNVLSEKLRVTTDRARLYENAVLEKKEIDKYNKEITDISKDLKKELQQKLEQIKLYSQVVESNQDAIITSEEQGTLLTGNEAFLRLFGYEDSRIKSLNLNELFTDLDITGAGFEKIIKEGWKGEKTANRQDKTTFPALISISPVKIKTKIASDKYTIVLATVVRDISLQKQYEKNILMANKELKQTYNELENTLKELEKSNKIKDRFLSNISSQLKTPLDSLINYAELMKKDSDEEMEKEVKSDFLLQIVQEGKKLEKLVGNLVTMAEMTSELSLSMEVIKYKSLVSEIKKGLDGVENLIFDIDPELTVITADRQKILKAFIEIIEYAVIKSGFNNKIYVKCLRNAEKNLLEVTITPGDLPAFFDTEEELSNVSDGIELSIQKGELELPLVKRIVEMHNGEMRIASSNGDEQIFLKLPLDPNAESGSRIRVIIIDEHEWDRRIIKGIIEKQFVLNEIFEFDTQISALNALNALKPNLIIVDPFFDDQKWEYDDFLKKLMEGNQKKVSTLVISDQLLDLDFRNNIISMGITDFLFKPFTIEEALFKINSIIETEQKFYLLSNNIQKAKKSAATDGMTGLFNRKYFDSFFKEQILKAELQNGNCSLIMLDVDNFKHYNDTNGHQLGDEVLKKVAKILQTRIRQSDMAARYGGEEFVVVLPGTAKKMAENIAEKLRMTIEKAKFENEDKQPRGKLTASFGVSSYPENGSEPETLLKGADDCLYQAKELGRNKVVGAEGIVKV